MFKHLIATILLAALLFRPGPGASADKTAFETYGDISRFAIPGIAACFAVSVRIGR